MHLRDELLSAYLDGELPPSDLTAAASHLAACAACSQTLRRYSALDGRLAALPTLSCGSAGPLVSAHLDAELAGSEAIVAEAHLAGCAACRTDLLRWAAADTALAALPLSRPAARVDQAIAALGRRPAGRRVPRAVVSVPLSAIAAALAVALIVFAGLPRGAGDQAVLRPSEALVAAVQQSVLNPETGTLYVLHPDDGTVAVVDAQSLVQKSVISVGGRPTALALNSATNTILVLDATAKTVTEIDGSRNTVTSSTAVAVPGRPTSLQVDPSGNVVVTAVAVDPASAQRAGPQQAPVTGGVVAVLNGETKAVQSVKPVDVAPQLVVLEPNGRRALLISADATTLVDATSFAPLAATTGGVAAAFAASGDDFAILSARPGGAVVTFARRSGSLGIGGTPRAITPLPSGGFAVLSEVDGGGRITLVLADGSPGGSIDVPATGRDLAYDPALRQFAVVSRSGVATVPLPATLAVLSQPVVAAAPANTPLPTAPPVIRDLVAPSPPPTPSPSPPPSAPSISPALLPPVLSPSVPADPLAPAGGRLAWPGHYVVPIGHRINATASDGARIWSVDEANRVSAYHLLTGQRFVIGQLPAGAIITRIVVGPDHVYLADSAGVLYVLTISTEQLAVVPLPFLTIATAITASPDERLWMATSRLGLVSFDPRTRRIEKIAVGLDLSAVASDPLGRIWVAAGERQAIDTFDPLTGAVSEIAIAHDGAISALFIDPVGTVWLGTDRGSMFTLRNGRVGQVRGVNGKIAGLIPGPGGQAWYVASSADLVAGPAGGTGSLHGPLTAAGPVFDSLGRAWQADPGSSSFFVTLPGSLP